MRLSHYLNKGYKLKNSVMHYIYWHTFSTILYNKPELDKTKLNKKLELQKKKIENRSKSLLKLHEFINNNKNLKRADLIQSIYKNFYKTKNKADEKIIKLNIDNKLKIQEDEIKNRNQILLRLQKFIKKENIKTNKTLKHWKENINKSDLKKLISKIPLLKVSKKAMYIYNNYIIKEPGKDMPKVKVLKKYKKVKFKKKNTKQKKAQLKNVI
jgi:hypothetical protein